MHLKIQYDRECSADGVYRVKAFGCIVASLWWGNDEGILPNWTAFAYIPLSATGEGSFRFVGERAVPDDATCVIARAISSDCESTQQIAVPIPSEQKSRKMNTTLRLCVASDLHFTEGKRRITHALRIGASCDAILLAGDMTNDGTSAQLRAFSESIRQNAGDAHVFAVAGNHDFPVAPEAESESRFQYYDFQNDLLRDAETRGLAVERDSSGTYAVRLGDIEIIGIDCVTDYRKFKFPEGQIEWLDAHLDDPSDAAWRIILCHAPMIAYNTQRAPESQPYLNKDIKLQRILNAHKNIIFISGHTHFSPNDYNGCVYFDTDRNNVYINDGSVCPTTSKWREPIVPGEWCDGIVTFLSLNENEIGITPYSVASGKYVSRGYYRYTARKD